MGDEVTRTLVIPSEIDQVGEVATAILKDIQSFETFREEAVFGIRLSLDEAVTNAIRHGNQRDPSKHVTVEYRITAEVCRVTICDEGSGFHPEDVPDPTLAENLCRPHGRGVMLMKAYMTEVSFNKEGNCVTLVKRADCPLPND